MELKTKNAETSAGFEIQNLHVGKSWPTLTFSRFGDKAKTIPEDFPQVGVYTMEIHADSKYTSLLETITQGPRLILDDNKIIVSANSTQNIHTEGTKHFRIFVTSGPSIIQVAHGTLKFIV